MTRQASFYLLMPLFLFGCSKPDTGPSEAQKAATYRAEAEAVEKERAQREEEAAAKMVENAKKKAADVQAAESAKQVDIAMGLVRKRLFDEESAKFRNVRANSSATAVCGEVNAKNKMGGYTGFSQFIVMDGMAVVKPEEKGLEYTIFQNFESKANCPASSDD